MASGVAQLFSVVGIWVIIISLEQVKAPWGAIVRILISGAVMAMGVALVVRHFSPALAILLGVPAGAIVYLGCIRMLGVLNAADRYRLRSIGHRLPAGVRPAWMKAVDLLAGGGPMTES